jgi:hypothetical protein
MKWPDELGQDGWRLVSAEDRHCFLLPGSIIRFSPEHICDADAGPPPEHLDALMRLAKPAGAHS